MRPPAVFVAHLVAGVLLAANAQAAHAQSKADCLACHSDSSTTTKRAGKEVSLFVDSTVLDKSAHTKLVCVACHTGFNPDDLPHKARIEPVACVRCHAAVQLKHAFHPQLARAIAAHQDPKVTCKECHSTHDVASPKVAGSKFSEGRVVESCGKCHEKASAQFTSSEHGKALAKVAAGAPTCLSCHRHRITVSGRTAADTLAAKRAQMEVCAGCHDDAADVRARMPATAAFISGHDRGPHHAALERGVAGAASCVSCHSSHDARKTTDAASPVTRANVATTCAKCHAEEARHFSQSVHVEAARKDTAKAPVCSTCHREHETARNGEKAATPKVVTTPAEACGTCHKPVVIAATFGLSGDQFKAFGDSYHGFAARGGALEASNCASCHTAHDVKAGRDSASSVSKANLTATCGKCHRNGSARFGASPVHAGIKAQGLLDVRLIIGMAALALVVVVAGMFMRKRGQAA